jgi:hypothetical protein
MILPKTVVLLTLPRAGGAELHAAMAALDSRAPAERHFPLTVVAGHGIFAVATVVLALLAALGV